MDAAANGFDEARSDCGVGSECSEAWPVLDEVAWWSVAWSVVTAGWWSDDVLLPADVWSFDGMCAYVASVRAVECMRALSCALVWAYSSSDDRAECGLSSLCGVVASCGSAYWWCVASALGGIGLGKMISSVVASGEAGLIECSAAAEDSCESNFAYLYAACSEGCVLNVEGAGVAMSMESACNVSCTCLDWSTAGEACGVESRDSSVVSNIGYEGGRGMAYVNMVMLAFVCSEVPGVSGGSGWLVSYV